MIYWLTVTIVLVLILAVMVGLAWIPVRIARRKGRTVWPYFLPAIPFPFLFPFIWVTTFIMARGMEDRTLQPR